MDIPADLRLELYNSGKNKGLVLGSKAVGETPQNKTRQGKAVAHKFHPGEASVLGGVSVLMALR